MYHTIYCKITIPYCNIVPYYENNIAIYHIAASTGMPHPSRPRRCCYRSSADVSPPSSRRTGPSSTAISRLSSHPARSSPSLCRLLPCCPLSSSCRPSKSSCVLPPCCPLPLSCRVVVPPVAVVYRPSPLSCRPSKLIVESIGPSLCRRCAACCPHVCCRPTPSSPRG